jgi:phage tail sheath gpL-like
VSQLISAFAADNFVPGIATQARAAVASSPSANTAMRLLLTGFKLAGGSMATGTISGPVTSEAQCDEIVAVGSELSRMFRAARARTKDVEVWLGCVAEPSGAQAFARLTISGTWSTAGSFTIYVDGDPLIVEVNASDATTDVAAAIDAVNALYPSLSYTTAADGSSSDLTKNQKGTRGNSSILYVDTTNAPSGLVVTLEPPLGELLSIVNELRTDLLAHFALTTGSVHGGADSTSGAAFGSAATTHATAITLINQLRTGYEAHRVLTSGSVHGAADSTNALTVAAATTAAGAVLLANDIKAKYNAHRVLLLASVHGAADATNVTASADATDGAVTGDDVTGAGVRFAGGSGTEDVSALIGEIESDPLWYKRIVVSSLDVTNLGKWEVFQDAQNAPMVARPSALILAHLGTQSAAQAISKTQLNHEAFEVLWSYDAETPAAEIAAVHAIDRVLTERNGPEGWNQSYSGSILPGVRLARDKAKLASDNSTQASALRNGLSPLTKTAAGEAMIVRAIWSRCQNADGSPNYLGLDVAEETSLQETRESAANTWKFWRALNPHVRDNFGKEPTVPNVATPDGWKTYLFGSLGQQLVAARVFETLPTIRASYNRTTRRIQWELDFSRMPLHEQSEGVITSMA